MQVKRKTKRLEAWGRTNQDGELWNLRPTKDQAVYAGTQSDSEAELVHLVECGPDEVVVPKAAADVVRAAVRLADNMNSSDARYINDLCRAVERMKGVRR